MLSLFPELFDWSWYVPFVLRLLVAYYFITIGYHLARFIKEGSDNEKAAWNILGGLVIVTGLLILIGLFTQAAAAVAFAWTLLALYFRKKNATFTLEPARFYFLLGCVALSLIFLGPGPFAFDLPL